MAVWEKATITEDVPNGRVDVDAGGVAWVRILSPSFRRNDGNDYTFVGFGNQLHTPDT